VFRKQANSSLQEYTIGTYRLVYNGLYRVFCCLECGFVITGCIFKHYNRVHNSRFSQDQKQVCQEWISTKERHPISRCFIDISHTSGPIEPVEGILVRPGFACSLCEFKTISRKRAKAHVKQHDDVSFVELMRSTQVQVLSRSPGINTVFEISINDDTTMSQPFNIEQFCSSVRFHTSTLITRCQQTLTAQTLK
jgi:hypothetical protein